MDSKPHKIIMLGGRRSGKSTILATIVHALKEQSGLFSVSDQTDYTTTSNAVSLDAKRREIQNYLNTRRNLAENGNFLVDMTASSGLCEYVLQTQIGGRAEVKFSFVDVQGEAMEVTSSFHKGLAEEIQQGDVFVIAIDTPYLMQDDNPNINEVWNRVDEIANLLNGNIKIEDEKLDKKLIILCPVKCERWTQHDMADAVADRACKAYRSLINNWVQHKSVDIWVMPIETAGGIEHTMLLDGYRLFRDENDRTGELCSMNELTGQIIDKGGKVVQLQDGMHMDNEPDKTLLYDFTQIPLSWYRANGKGFSPARCEQPAFHIFRFLVKKEELAVEKEKKEKIDNVPWYRRWYAKWKNPPFGKYLADYSELVRKMENGHLVQTSGNGFRHLEQLIEK